MEAFGTVKQLFWILFNYIGCYIIETGSPILCMKQREGKRMQKQANRRPKLIGLLADTSDR